MEKEYKLHFFGKKRVALGNGGSIFAIGYVKIHLYNIFCKCQKRR